MKIYFSALSKKHFEYLKQINFKVCYLKSYFEMRSKSEIDLHSMVDKFFLDSGAFSAFTQKKPIDIDKYIKFVRNNKHKITVYANLDLKESYKGTWENQKHMQKYGLNPLPVYHAGEPEKVLDYYCDKYDYVCLGGTAGAQMSTKVLERWVNAVFSKYPNQKFHGFGINNIDIVKTYPWESIDSTTYLNGSKYGHIFHENVQVHYAKLHGCETWDVLQSYLKLFDKTYEDFTSDPILRDIFNITQISKFTDIKDHSRLNQLTLF